MLPPATRPPSRGIGTRPAWFAWIDAAYAPLYAAGLCDTQAAAALGVSHSTVSECRRRLALPGNGGAGRRARSANSAEVGRRNAGRRAHDPAAYGLPAGLYAAQVRVVLALADGPRTLASIAAACGTTRRVISAGHNYRGVFWLRDLKARGLIESTPRAGPRPVLYFLTPLAMAALITAGTESPNEPDA